MTRLLGALLLCAAASASAETAPADRIVGYLAANSNPPERFGEVLERLDADVGGVSPAAVDHIAEYLIRVGGSRDLDGNDAAKLVALIDRRGGGRHVAAMKKLREQSPPVLVGKAAHAYLIAHKPAYDDYVPGTIDLAAARRRDIAAALTVETTDARARKLGELVRGDSLDRLFEVMGPPQHVGSFSMEVQRLRFYYRAAGRVVFAFVRGQGWELQSVVADPLGFEREMPYRAELAAANQPDDATLRMIQLASAYPVAAKVAIEDGFHEPKTLEYLDLSAEYLAQHWRAVSTRDEVDTCSLIVRMLSKHGGPRYAPLIREIADGTKDLKLIKWATMTIQKPDGVPRAPYVPGSVSFADAAQRYPSLYPGVTYTSGHL